MASVLAIAAVAVVPIAAALAVLVIVRSGSGEALDLPVDDGDGLRVGQVGALEVLPQKGVLLVQPVDLRLELLKDLAEQAAAAPLPAGLGARVKARERPGQFEALARGSVANELLELAAPRAEVDVLKLLAVQLGRERVLRLEQVALHELELLLGRNIGLPFPLEHLEQRVVGPLEVGVIPLRGAWAAPADAVPLLDERIRTRFRPQVLLELVTPLIKPRARLLPPYSSLCLPPLLLRLSLFRSSHC